MIVLDTNVISELMRPVPDERVRRWLADRDPLDLAITSITLAEIQRGILRLAEGRRRRDLEERFLAFTDEAFSERLLNFDRAAAYACGQVSARRERQGLHVDSVDMMIAGIVASHLATLATRNTSDFDECGITLINPWRQP